MQQMFTQMIFAISTGQPCKPGGGSFLGFPHWYEYLNGVGAPSGTAAGPQCVPQVSGLGDIWLILAALIDILLRIAALAAIGLVIWGGIQLITSGGDPADSKKGRQTVVNALIGLVIAVAATSVVSFVAGRFS